MGIAITPDGGRVAVGVYRSSGPSILDVFDTATLALTASVPVGIRPFQVVAAPDNRRIYSIDHDSYSVTVVDLHMMQPQPLQAMPLGRGAYDKPHYTAQRADGTLLLPYQGRTLQILDPTSGTQTLLPLSAQTHQHGVALTSDERRLLIVGTGPAGEVSGGPSLTILDLTTGSEEIVSLTKPHERIVLSQDGRRAFLTGGYLLTGGWNGLTVVDLDTRATREVAVPDAPLDIALLSPAMPSGSTPPSVG
jgi:YVTN family beta-propeller protein